MPPDRGIPGSHTTTAACLALPTTTRPSNTAHRRNYNGHVVWCAGVGRTQLDPAPPASKENDNVFYFEVALPPTYCVSFNQLSFVMFPQYRLGPQGCRAVPRMIGCLTWQTQSRRNPTKLQFCSSVPASLFLCYARLAGVDLIRAGNIGSTL